MDLAIGWIGVSRHDREKAVEILMKDLKVFSTINAEVFDNNLTKVFDDLTELLTLNNIRYYSSFGSFFDCRSVDDVDYATFNEVYKFIFVFHLSVLLMSFKEV